MTGIALLSSCPDKRLKSHVGREGCVEGLHHVNVLIEQHVAASKSSRDLSHRRELGAVDGISVLGKVTVREEQEVKWNVLFLTILQCRDHRCQRSINLPHLVAYHRYV